MVKIIGIPRINALGNKGPENMPEAIRKEMNNDFEIIDVDNFNIEKSEKQISEKAKEILENDQRVCFVGGDHSITYPIMKSFSEKYKDSFLIVMDAHADAMPPMKEPTHEEFLRAIIEFGFDTSKIILIGARKIEPEEKEFLDKNGIKVFGEIENVESVADYVTENAIGHDVYFSLDIDVLDPSYAPAVNYQEVNGIQIPYNVEVQWNLKSGNFSYAKFNIIEIEYNNPSKFK